MNLARALQKGEVRTEAPSPTKPEPLMNPTRIALVIALSATIACDDSQRVSSGEPDGNGEMSLVIEAQGSMSSTGSDDGPAATPGVAQVAPNHLGILGPIGCTVTDAAPGEAQAACAIPQMPMLTCPEISPKALSDNPQLATLASQCARYEAVGPADYTMVREIAVVDGPVTVVIAPVVRDQAEQGPTAFDAFVEAAGLLQMNAQIEVSYDDQTGAINELALKDARADAWHVITMDLRPIDEMQRQERLY